MDESKITDFANKVAGRLPTDGTYQFDWLSLVEMIVSIIDGCSKRRAVRLHRLANSERRFASAFAHLQIQRVVKARCPDCDDSRCAAMASEFAATTEADVESAFED